MKNVLVCFALMVSIVLAAATVAFRTFYQTDLLHHFGILK